MRESLFAVVTAVLASGCYDPIVADCVYQCNNGTCPSGLSCVGGLCTSGTTCGGGSGDAGRDAGADHAQCGDHLTFAGGELCFAPSMQVQAAAPAAPLLSPHIADWDGDGHRDLTVLVGKQLRYWHGKGDGTWEPSARNTQLADAYDRFLADDLNGDSVEDFFFAGTVAYAVYKGVTNSVPTQSFSSLNGKSVAGIASGHFSASSSAPRGVALSLPDELFVFTLLPDLKIESSLPFAVMTPDRVFGVAATLDQPEQRVSIATVAHVKTLEPSGNTLVVTSSSMGPPGVRDFASGDFDGDGLTDYVSVGMDSVVHVALGKFGGNQEATAAVTGGVQGLVIGNFDGDRYQDFVMLQSSTGQTNVLVFRGADNLSSITSVPAGDPIPGMFDAVGSGDFNGDTIDDLLLVGAMTGEVRVLLSAP